MRKKLRERSDATLARVTTPGCMVRPADLAAAGVVRSYSGINEWVRKKWLPPPRRLPNGGMYWFGETIADALARRPAEGAAE